MKNILLFIMVTGMLSSCRLVYTVIPTPNDDPGLTMNISKFNKSRDSLKIALDKFIENNTAFQRIYYSKKQDEGMKRFYRTICNNDSLEFSIWVGGNDNFSGFSVGFFRMNKLVFYDSDYNRERKAIKKNKTAYNTCQSCYEKIFLAPFSEYAKIKIENIARLEYRTLLLRYTSASLK